jgi:hypothetical protein
MKDPLTHAAIYRRLTALYPARFRDEYRPDLVALFEAQLRDEPPIRVWLRALRDLAVTVPTQQLEVRTNRPSSNLVAAVFSVAAASVGIIALTLGSAPTTLFLLIIGIATGAGAVWSWNAGRSVRVLGFVSRSWWRFLLAGSVLAVITSAAAKIPWPKAIDLGALSYWLIVVAGMTSLTLLGIGVLLSLATLVRRHRPRRAGAPAA